MSEPHVILTGPQRSGKSTTLEILTRCGWDTGFTIEEIENRDRGNPKGGNEFLEFPLWGENYKRDLPYVLKHARLSSGLQDRAKRFDWEIDRVLIFVRKVEDSVASAVQLDRGAKHKTFERRYYNRLGKIIYQCEINEWKYNIVKYEEVVTSWERARIALGPIGQQIHTYSFKDAWEMTFARKA